eukprot:2171462-Rhodomonas_salina.2
MHVFQDMLKFGPVWRKSKANFGIRKLRHEAQSLSVCLTDSDSSHGARSLLGLSPTPRTRKLVKRKC